MQNLEYKTDGKDNKTSQDKPTLTEIDELVEQVTLEVFNVGTKRINYQILRMLPTNIEDIMKETGLTKVPANNHANELERVGLLKREKGTGRVEPTKMTNMFKGIIQELEKQVKSNVLRMIPILTEYPETILRL